MATYFFYFFGQAVFFWTGHPDPHQNILASNYKTILVQMFFFKENKSVVLAHINLKKCFLQDFWLNKTCHECKPDSKLQDFKVFIAQHVVVWQAFMLWRQKLVWLNLHGNFKVFCPNENDAFSLDIFWCSRQQTK